MKKINKKSIGYLLIILGFLIFSITLCSIVGFAKFIIALGLTALIVSYILLASYFL